MVERIKTGKGKRHKGEGIVRTGEPCDVIVSAAKAKKADLIVMGSHGRRGVISSSNGQRYREGHRP